MSPDELVTRLTKAMRVADRAFESAGGGTRHHVRECLVPALEDEGLAVVDAEHLAALEAGTILTQAQTDIMTAAMRAMQAESAAKARGES